MCYVFVTFTNKKIVMVLQDKIRAVSQLLKEYLPLHLRTSVVNRVSELNNIWTTGLAINFILLHILSDVTEMKLINEELDKFFWVRLNHSDSQMLLEELQEVTTFRLENLELEGLDMPYVLLAELLRRSPSLTSLKVPIHSYLPIYQSIYLSGSFSPSRDSHIKGTSSRLCPHTNP